VSKHVAQSESRLPPTLVAGVDVAEALRLLHQSGYPDPTQSAAGDTEVLQQVVNALCDPSLHDGLTGLANARMFRLTLEREVERATRTGEPCTLLLLDLDHFKAVNDTHGHLAGDVVLQTVAKRLMSHLRPMDTVARYGGEEFAVILPNSYAAYAMQTAERIRRQVADGAIDLGQTSSRGQATTICVTVSIGMSSLQPWAPRSADALLAAADRNLYQAKAQGRNRIWGEAPPTSSVGKAERTALFR